MRSLTEQEIMKRFSFTQLQELATLGALREDAQSRFGEDLDEDAALRAQAATRRSDAE